MKATNVQSSMRDETLLGHLALAFRAPSRCHAAASPRPPSGDDLLLDIERVELEVVKRRKDEGGTFARVRAIGRQATHLLNLVQRQRGGPCMGSHARGSVATHTLRTQHAACTVSMRHVACSMQHAL
eukprot:354633-Chlamydomonas_euryale.AAC.21